MCVNRVGCIMWGTFFNCSAACLIELAHRDTKCSCLTKVNLNFNLIIILCCVPADEQPWSRALHLHFLQVRLDDRVLHTDRGLLIRSLHASDAGVYVCVAQEHTHFTHTLLRITLQLVTHGQLDGKSKHNEDPMVELRHGAESRQRYKDYLRVMSSPIGSLEEYCDSLWLEKRPSRARGRGLGGGKWKHIQEMKKSRNRRHHRERGEERGGGRVVRTAQPWGWGKKKKNKIWMSWVFTYWVMKQIWHRTV